MKRLFKKTEAKRQPGRQRLSTPRQAPPSAFSYRAQRNSRPDTPSRQQPTAVQQRSQMLSVQFWLKRSSLIIALLVVAVCLVSIVSLSSTPRVEIVNQPSATRFRTTDVYAKAISRELGSSFWNHNKITVDGAGVSRQLQRQYPELSNVSMTLPLVGHRPIFYLTTNPAAFVFQSTSGTYVLDSSGTALTAKSSATTTQTAQLLTITDQTGTRVAVGQRVISAANADFIKTLVANLQAKRVTVSSLVLPAGTAQELDVHLAGQAYYIKCNLHVTNGAQQQAGTYLATIQSLQAQHIVPSQYVDVRVAGRAYYM